MGDILVTSIWNRVMISNFGIPAAPVSLLIALRYLMSPLSLWAGFQSDTKTIFGLRRTPFIWAGRLMMILSLPLLGLSLMRFGAGQADFLGWAFALASSLLYGIGTLISGSPYLALVRDSAPPKKQGLAISTVETALIIFFAITGITFGLWMEVYNEAIFWQMVAATVLIGGFFWFFAILGVEKRVHAAEMTEQQEEKEKLEFSSTMRRILRDPRTRGFFLFLSLATLSAWMQDAILEPFGAEVLDLSAGRTTRFNSFWQTATVITLVGGGFLWRKRPPERQVGITAGGLITMALGMIFLAMTAFTIQVRLVEIALFVFGAGFGVYTFGALSLMAVMSSDRSAGAYLGLWTISILVFKGLGTFFGGAMRDLLLLNFELPGYITYGAIFLVSSLGLLASVLVLTRIDILGFASDAGRIVSRTEAQVMSAD